MSATLGERAKDKLSTNTPTNTSGVTLTPTSRLSGHHHRGRRLRNFILPNGREVHIALSPEEAESLRQRLTAVRDPSEPFDLVINGSPEHLEALRKTLSHHEERREALRLKHGDDFDEFENVRTELDQLGSELHMLTDHAVALDANFSKYGYRTYDDTSSPVASRASSISGTHDEDHEKKDWEAEKRNGRIMKLYKKPTVRQYFHKGLLWRASESTEVQSFELFIDLLYVGILALNGDHAADDPTGSELLRFTITFIMSWKIWSDITVLISWFETDDILQRLSVVFIMACLLGLTTNMLDAFVSTYAQLVAFYMTARLFMVAYSICLAVVVPMVRPMMITQAIVAFIPCILWISSIYIDMPNRLAIIWIAIFLDLTGSMYVVFCIRYAKKLSPKIGERLDKLYEFYPAVNIEHKTERTNAFVTLVFGYSVVAIIYQNAASFGLNAFFGKAVLGLLQAFCFNWIYFELDALLWATAHLPFIMSFVLAAGSLSKLVLATDCSDTKLEDLTEAYSQKSDRDIPQGLRIISLCHVHKEASGHRIRIPKRRRLLNRFAVCIILFCLPLAHWLNSLQLVATTTGLIIYLLVLELWGMSCPNESFFGEKKPSRCKVMKKDWESAVKGGHVIQVQQLADGGEKGMYELS
ncbi:hypothetical protein D0Z07_5884 [Hyphodiscus hymeniophilus]|uniref:Low temperature requirement a protein n=1 Tax=Hyphodiscus hymeniophilus TaxID=353542 RepID=A0A9P6VI27_9HELO|nr:hypothetical protein D0Z07_5884 [Hyphodiscus hymeniophilus]